MSQAAEAHDSWADQPDSVPQRRRRREAESWATAEDLEMLSGIGRPRSADWTVLTLERDDEDQLSGGMPEYAEAEPLPRQPARQRITSRPSLTIAQDERSAVAELQAAREGRALAAHERDELPREDDPYAVAPPELAPNGRRTVVVRGQVAERQVALPATNQRRRPARRPSERIGHRPDRVAMYAVGLGFLLILVALLSAGGS
ncbi:MAG: hypothetical protein JWP17_3241 [Solirubrobacterales bacterium]|nr:hypothetical protein [Solirubrobacterales bacterium]